jgi:endonuclease-8
VLRGGAWEARQWNGPVLTLDERPVRRLGPDLLAAETEVEDVVRRLRLADPERVVGEALLDQRLVAGIGNMWLAEALWHARVSPWRMLRDVGDEELEGALRFAQEHMRASAAGARPSRAAYRRSGRSCPRCGTPIRSRGLGETNRTAYWCPTCQPDGAP